MSKKITLENVDSSELPEIPVIGEVKQIRFTQDMELVSTLADSDLFMVQAGADLEARPNTITFDLIIKNLSGPIEEGSKKFVTGDMMFKVIGDMNLLNTWDNTNIVSSLNATYVNVRRIEEELRREINRSTGKDEQHDEQIANLRQDLTATNEMLNQEINRSVAKDNEHDELLAGLRDDVDSTSDKLDAEIDRSTAKDAEHDTLLKGLRVDVNANKSAIESEVARSTARDEAHDEAIAKNASDITTEVNRAKAEEAKIRQEMQTADTNLQNAITAETERATGVEEDLQQQITDLSGSTDDRLDALEALSHEQNTDTGTTSKTFVIDSSNTGAMLKAEGGGLSTRTKGDAGYANFTVNNLVIKGDVTQEGDTFITRAERVEVRDNMILINEGETGAGVTAGFAGIEVDRGTEQNFMFGFNESDGMFKIGKEGNMFDVALRQPVGDMTDGMFASWDAATKTFKTTNLIPPTLQLYFGVPEVSVKYASDNNGSLQFVTNDKSWSVYTGVGSTKFTSSENRFRFYGEVNISDGVLKCDVNSFQIQVASANKLVISGSGSTLSTPLTANSFFRASDNAEVLYAVDPTTLTDGMFLSWDADNKKVVTTNKLPIGKKLYIAYDHTYITEGGSDGIEFNTRDAWLRVSTGSVESRFVSSANWFLFEGNISTTGKIATTGTNLRLENKSNYLSIGNGASTMDTTLKATTFYRSSDNSEVLYQADLKSVLTGKETNYAPTVKAVSDAIDAVNTGTTESLKGYLKLSGGTMTGSIRIVDSGNSGVLQGIYNNDGTKALLFTYLKGSENRWGVGTKEYVGVIRSNVSDLIHLVNNNGTLNEYSIYDKRNLPDPATKSGNNAFTGTNSFVGGKFSVAGSESEVYVSAVGDLVTRSTYGTTGWIRSLEFSDNNVVVARFGVKAVTTNNVPTTNFVGILVGNGTVNDSQYKFSLNKMEVPSVFILSTANGVSKILSASSGRMKFGDYQCECYLESKNVDLIHNKNNVAYKIWDASNLPDPASTTDIPDVSDMARRSEANTFTANNTFTAGQFNVGPLEVTSSGSILVNLSETGGWERSITWENNSDQSTKVMVGGCHNAGDAFVWMGVGDLSYGESQYRFYGTKMVVPTAWSLDDKSGNSLVWSESTQLAHLGRAMGTTKIRSGAVDLIHTKGTTDYKILDESNYSQYLPTSSKWTYGFVGMQVGSANQDLNTILNGDNNIKAVLNYYQVGALTNAPTGMSYGSVFQLYTNGFTIYGSEVLKPQLAFDVNHNVAGSTRYMYFRTPNNLGYGDSSNWKRVVTADENVAALSLDSNGYPALVGLGGTSYNYTRVTGSGLLPNVPVSIANGGASALGTASWAFKNAYIANIYANKYYFGNTGKYLFVGNDGCYFGTPSSNVKLLTTADNVITAVGGENYVNVSLSEAARTSVGAAKYLEWYDGTPGWYNFRIGGLVANGILQSNSANKILQYYHNSAYHDAISINDGVGYLMIGNYSSKTRTFLLSNASDVLHYRSTDQQTGTPYTMWDAYNLDKPVRWGGSAAGIHTIYARNLGINGATYGFLSENNSNSTSIFAPTTAGTSGQILKSSGTGAPVWANVSTILSDYATQSWANGQFAPLATYTLTSNYPTIINIGNEYVFTSNQKSCVVNHRTPSGKVVPSSWYWRAGSSTSYANAYFGNLYMSDKLVATQEWVSGKGYLTSITKSMVTTALGYTPPTTNTTYSQATSSTLGLVKIGATGLASKNYAVQLNSSGQMYVAVPWTDTNTIYSAATSSTYGLVKIGATGLAAKNYAVQLNSSGQMYVAVPWTDTDTNTHYTTRLYAGASGTAANSATTSPYIKVTDDNTCRNQIRLLGGGATSVSSDAFGNITITSTNTTYDLSSYLKENDNISKLTNDRAYVRSTSTLRVNDIQVVEGAAGTATGVLYVVLES